MHRHFFTKKRITKMIATRNCRVVIICGYMQRNSKRELPPYKRGMKICCMISQSQNRVFEAFNVKSGDHRLHLQQHSIDTTSFILVTPIYTLHIHSTSRLYCAGYSEVCARPNDGRSRLDDRTASPRSPALSRSLEFFLPNMKRGISSPLS